MRDQHPVRKEPDEQAALIQQLLGLLYPLTVAERQAVWQKVESRLARLTEQDKGREPENDPLLKALHVWNRISTRTLNVITDALRGRSLYPENENALRLSLAARLSRADLKHTIGCGKKTLQELTVVLDEYGLFLTPDAVTLPNQSHDRDANPERLPGSQPERQLKAMRQLDQKLLHQHDDGHVSYRALGEQLGVSSGRVRQRIERERNRQELAARFPHPQMSESSADGRRTR